MSENIYFLIPYYITYFLVIKINFVSDFLKPNMLRRVIATY